mgnify:CR=1 FL=1|tara:strand:- start:2484 stop:4802 length:2319 start_codon:yes stop_codon:yes gene_type:complete
MDSDEELNWSHNKSNYNFWTSNSDINEPVNDIYEWGGDSEDTDNETSFLDDSSFYDEHSFINEVYQANKIEVARLKQLKEDKNWIPENLTLTKNDDMPIIYINSTKEKPEIYSIKLATITLGDELALNFNLKVIANYIELDEYVIGAKLEQECQRGWFKHKPYKPPKPPKKSVKPKSKSRRKDKCDFKNQCTLNVKPYGDKSDEIINIKMFPNGKIVFVGVKRVEDAQIAFKKVLEKINNLKGDVLYFPNLVEWGNAKNFRKKLKIRQPILEYITSEFCTSQEWNDFIDNIETKGKNPYPDGIKLPFNIRYGLTILQIIMTYWELDFSEQEINNLKSDKSFNNFLKYIKSSFKTSNTNIDKNELYLIICGLGADQKFMLPIRRILYLIFDMDQQSQIDILEFYLKTNQNYNLENIIQAMDSENWEYSKIAKIKLSLKKFKSKNFLFDWKNYSFDQLTKIYKYFKIAKDMIQKEIKEIQNIQAEKLNKPKLNLKIRPKSTSNKNTEDEDSKKLDQDELDDQHELDHEVYEVDDPVEKKDEEVSNIIEIQENIKQETKNLGDWQNENKDRFFLNLSAWSTKDSKGFSNGLTILDLYDTSKIYISNINTTFNTNFILSKENLHQILVKKYNQTDCSLEPNYGGINLSYLSIVDCDKHHDPNDPSIVPEYNGCKCKNVSILIFPNITLITGGRSFRQIMESYHFIKSVMLTEFDKIIIIDKNNQNPIDKYPNIIADNKNVFLKKKHILDSPKNYFIIKNLGFLDKFHYLTDDPEIS